MNDNITEINKDTFWALIQEAKDTCGQDTDAWAKYMIDRLAGLGPDQSLMFLNYMDAYKDLSFRYGLWDAAKIFRVDGCSDDSFSYFRSWLIVQGKDVYMAALADPDSLADVEPYADCFFETAGYMARYIAKNIVAAGLAERCTVSLAYAIGKVKPVMVEVDAHGTGKYSDTALEQAVRTVCKLTPNGMIDALGLNKPIFRKFCNYGHFTHADAPWEQTDMTEVLESACRAKEAGVSQR